MLEQQIKYTPNYTQVFNDLEVRLHLLQELTFRFLDREQNQLRNRVNSRF